MIYSPIPCLDTTLRESKMKKDISLIPHGPYCYSESRGRGRCPYWELREDKPSQMNGYCHFLEKGDWELHQDSEFTTHNPTTKELIIVKGRDVPFPVSLLWDQVKECGINDEFDEEE